MIVHSRHPATAHSGSNARDLTVHWTFDTDKPGQIGFSTKPGNPQLFIGFASLLWAMEREERYGFVLFEPLGDEVWMQVQYTDAIVTYGFPKHRLESVIGRALRMLAPKWCEGIAA